MKSNDDIVEPDEQKDESDEDFCAKDFLEKMRDLSLLEREEAVNKLKASSLHGKYQSFLSELDRLDEVERKKFAAADKERIDNFMKQKPAQSREQAYPWTAEVIATSVTPLGGPTVKTDVIPPPPMHPTLHTPDCPSAVLANCRAYQGQF